MLTRLSFRERFATHALFGMVHLAPLPGAPLFGGSLDGVIDGAVRDARALRDGGCDGIVFENFGDRPFFKGRVGAETVAAMTRVIVEVTREVAIPFGVNVLRNDGLSALAIAAATGASFIRVNVHSGAVLTDQGLIEGDAAATLRMRASLDRDVAIFADHLVKHATPIAAADPISSAKDLRLRGLADVVIVSGSETGAPPSEERLAALRAALDAPLLIGSGLSEENCDTFEADGAIVGTAVKEGGRVDAPVDRARVERLVARFKRRGVR